MKQKTVKTILSRANALNECAGHVSGIHLMSKGTRSTYVSRTIIMQMGIQIRLNVPTVAAHYSR